MLLKTLIENQNRLSVALVEIQMIPGLPQIHFLGLPDKVIKESFFRIKAALKSSGYHFPVTQQVIVNIRPSSLKKSSLGLELAVALGILHLTGQRLLPDLALQHIIYGELDLDGGVREPIDLQFYKSTEQLHILTGKRSSNQGLKFSQIAHLKNEIEFEHNQIHEPQYLEKPTVGLNSFFTETEAEIIFLMAVSRLHVLLAGPAGSGKSYIAQNFSSFGHLPLLSPHHSLTVAAFLGGGAQLLQGEIEKVGQGTLVLDELLEFNPQILESLREPMTGQILRIARSSRVKEIQPTFQVIATTNFCPCGKWVPDLKYNSCRFSVQKCKGYLNRLSGPLVDRFGLIFFHQLVKEKRSVSGQDILQRIKNFILTQQSGNVLSLVHDEEIFNQFYGDLSGRRKTALLKIAEIYAKEAQHEKIEINDLKKSENWTVNGFLQLEKGMC